MGFLFVLYTLTPEKCICKVFHLPKYPGKPEPVVFYIHHLAAHMHSRPLYRSRITESCPSYTQLVRSPPSYPSVKQARHCGDIILVMDCVVLLEVYHIQ